MNGAAVLSGTFAERYIIERELGAGGSAVVYLARDIQRGHAVAIKVLRPELAQSVGADRFLKEIRVSQQLHHPHIVPVLDSGSWSDQLYFVLAHMEGGTLRSRLQKEKQLALDEAIAITRQIGDALDNAHGHGLVHRDVKPENILFTSGQACLADFGIARALESAIDATTTSTSVVRGTPQYMSPEQASGERDLDGRTDVYSLACVFYEMVAGIPPFVGPTPQSVIAQRLTHAPRPLGVFRRGIAVAVEEVVSRAMMIVPAERYATAGDFARSLAAAAEAPQAAAGSSRAGTRRWLPVAIGLVAVLAAILLLPRSESPPSSDGTIPDGDVRRVAVLYLDARSPSTPLHIVDGITEDLIDQLAAVRALHVISPNGVRPFRGSRASPDSIGRALNVGTIVSGSVARSGNRLLVNMRLIDAKGGRLLHSQEIERPWGDVFSLQRELAEQVAFSLRQRIGEQVSLRTVRRQTRSYAAWENVQLASAEFRRAVEHTLRGNPPDIAAMFLRADSLYARAEQVDPHWEFPTVKRGYIALALAAQTTAGSSVPPPGRIDTAVFAAMPLSARRHEWMLRAAALADSALKRAPESPEALALRGDLRYRIGAGSPTGNDSLMRLAEQDLSAAIAARPDFASAWSTLAALQLNQGRFAEAATAAERAFEADAFFEVRRTVSAALNASLFAGQYDRARRWCRLGLDRYPGDPRFAECELTILGWTGRSHRDAARAWELVAAIEAADSMKMLAASWGYRRAMVAAVLARSGESDSARRMIATLRDEGARDPRRRLVPVGEAYVRVLLGDLDEAAALLGAYLRETPSARPLTSRHPWFRALTEDPRFARVLQGGR